MTRTELTATAVAAVLAVISTDAKVVWAQDGVDEIEEIVVLATRREKSIQSVPVSISAFSAEQLENLGVDNLQDLIEFVPGAYIVDDRNAGQPTWIIRGVGLADFNSNNTPTAAVFYDDVYLGSNILGGIGMYDIERVEVLKGPQGGLFGRNTTGGAVQVISKKPDMNESHGSLRASYGSWDRVGLQAAVGGPMGDKAGYRLAAMVDQGGGWQDSLATLGVDDKWGDRDVWAFRGQIRFLPADNVDVLLKLETGSDQSEAQLATAIAQASSIGPGFCLGLANGRRDPSCWTGHNLYNFINNGFAPPVGSLASEQTDDGEVVLSDPINKLDNDWVSATGTINWDLGTTTLTSITSYIGFDNRQVFDTDASPLEILHEDLGDVELTSWAQELRLTSDDAQKTTWLVGAVFANEEIDDRREFPLEDLLGFGAPGLVSAREWSQDTESWSIYGELGVQVSEAVNIHGALRYTDEEKDLKGLTVEFPAEVFYIIDNRGLPPLEYSLDENVAGSLGIDWTVSDSAMIYASVTQAHKSGGFFGGFAFSVEEYEFYNEESNLAYEVGLKSQFADNSVRLNAAVFVYDYEDIQGFTRQESGLIKLANLGDAEFEGVEAELEWLPRSLPGFRLMAGVSFIDTEITSANGPAFAADGTEYDPTGLSIGVPERAYQLQASYQHEFSNGMGASFHIDYSDRDDLIGRDSFGEIDEVGYLIFGRSGYSMMNARIALQGSDDRWDVALVGRNITDEEYFQNAGWDNFDSYREFANLPQSWAIEFGYSW